ncbi:MAG: Sec-independent protein translocase protein TatB [Gammaproteobacteria bacterium]|nr:Sec-independent protein translocase protein TatB [Gammaproteobacteria bacterium]
MFDIGFWELVLISVLALIVLGPKRLPEAARFAGKWVARIRNFIASVKDDFDEQLKSEELAELRKLKEELTRARDNLNQSSAEIAQTLNQPVSPEPDYLIDAIEGKTANSEEPVKTEAVGQVGEDASDTKHPKDR